MNQDLWSQKLHKDCLVWRQSESYSLKRKFTCSCFCRKWLKALPYIQRYHYIYCMLFTTAKIWTTEVPICGWMNQEVCHTFTKEWPRPHKKTILSLVVTLKEPHKMPRHRKSMTTYLHSYVLRNLMLQSWVEVTGGRQTGREDSVFCSTVGDSNWQNQLAISKQLEESPWMTFVVTNGSRNLYRGPLTRLSALHWHDLQTLILKGCSQE